MRKSSRVCWGYWPDGGRSSAFGASPRTDAPLLVKENVTRCFTSKRKRREGKRTAKKSGALNSHKPGATPFFVGTHRRANPLASSVIIVRVKVSANEYQSLAKSIQNALKFLFCCDRNTFGRAFTANN